MADTVRYLLVGTSEYTSSESLEVERYTHSIFTFDYDTFVVGFSFSRRAVRTGCSHKVTRQLLLSCFALLLLH